MSFAAAAEKIWPVTPDWSNGMQETLSWMTDYLQASATAVSQHRGLRLGPRRSFVFELLAAGKERRVADMLLAGHKGAWLLPIWPDVQLPAGPLESGDSFISCRTVGFDFVEGGKALIWAAVNNWEVVSIAAVDSTGLALASPLASDWPAATRLYPLRRARVQDGAEEILRNDNVSRRSIAFDVTETCDWPTLIEPATYLSHLVLERRPDESDDPSASYLRLAQAVDNGTGHPVVHDLPGVSLRTQQSHWKLWGRDEHSWFRSLLYTLGGRCTPIWVPSFASDLKAASPVAGGSTLLNVEWAGYALFGLAKANRKDILIEMRDGTKLYRRIIGAVQAGDTENLTIDSPLDDSSVSPGSIRAISFMALSTLSGDDVEIDHRTDQDGEATATTGWQAVVPDV
ncbi:hypothetical protein [Stenotrophomonas forensis]|uniref:hypothetical protein n=1 Tax=Stenotrophomonas forensis TaxID=2871169 RepID=UPI0018D3D9BD|nr:hypothetical protein [Stenotrophomonas maltophilia]MBH1501869.1 hypothetical protein [Stenotrophomonas maltophilia]MBH1785062.1 hypothetical protein [Stenotrophomonas maltophilia]